MQKCFFKVGRFLFFSFVLKASAIVTLQPVLPPLQPEQYPTQQFVTSESGDNEEVQLPISPSSTAIPVAEAPNNPEVSLVPPPNAPPSPDIFDPNAGNENNVYKEFEGGIDETHFLYCEKIGASLCWMTTNSPQFQSCLVGNLRGQPFCKQFLAFASATKFGLKDDIDALKKYPEANLELVHVKRFGVNYPGIYYAIGGKGNLIDIIFGSQLSNINIRKDPHYPEIAARFPKAELFSLVEEPPQTPDTTPPNVSLRLIFRFQLLNGCETCERAGQANIAYDFSEDGALINASLLSLVSPPPS